MTSDEIVEYWLPAVKAIYGRYELSTNTCFSLDELLGLNEYRQYLTAFPDYKPLPEELKKLLVMLAGPHGKTILKMYRIRKGLE